MRLLFDSPPEPWECAVELDAMRAHLADRSAMDATDSDHAAWFYGAGSERPRWVGYAIAGAWLASDLGLDAEATIEVPADVV